MKLTYYIFYLKEDEKQKMVDGDEQEVFNPRKTWESFINQAKQEYKLDETEIIFSMLGIMRTGFCVAERRTYLSASAILIIYTSPDYRKLLKKSNDCFKSYRVSKPEYGKDGCLPKKPFMAPLFAGAHVRNTTRVFLLQLLFNRFRMTARVLEI